MKLWSGRFQKATDHLVDDFNSSIHFDQRMYREDIEGSIAHAKMLGKQNIISIDDSLKIINGLLSILEDIENGEVTFLVDCEDIHMNIETLLIEKIGNVGKKLHTARSRNDQVALDIRLNLRKECNNIHDLVLNLARALIDISESHLDTIMPGYTHLQKAQPITLAHHLMAYVAMLTRDIERLNDAKNRLNVLPLGSGALATSTYPLDRKAVMEELDFDDISYNSLDAVSDRDFIIEIASSLSILMMHLSRLSEEVILWASNEFSFIELDDAFSTGSSIMPQKKNPDIAELVRGKTGRVYGDLMTILTVMKGLPLAYNKDMQEDKECIFDAVDTVKMCLPVFTNMLKTAEFNKSQMYTSAQKGFTNATDLADYLVKKGLAFRDCHEIVGKVVNYCIVKDKAILDLTIEELKSFSDKITSDVFLAISIEECVNARNNIGGPSKESVKDSIAYYKKKLKI